MQIQSVQLPRQLLYHARSGQRVAWASSHDLARSRERASDAAYYGRSFVWVRDLHAVWVCTLWWLRAALLQVHLHVSATLCVLSIHVYI